MLLLLMVSCTRGIRILLQLIGQSYEALDICIMHPELVYRNVAYRTSWLCCKWHAVNQRSTCWWYNLPFSKSRWASSRHNLNIMRLQLWIYGTILLPHFPNWNWYWYWHINHYHESSPKELLVEGLLLSISICWDPHLHSTFWSSCHWLYEHKNANEF